MENKPVNSHSELEIKKPDYKISDRSIFSYERRWRLSISYKTDVYLTRDEKDFFIEQIANGKKIIRVNDVILTNKFLSLIPVGDIGIKYDEYEKDKRTREEKEEALQKLEEIKNKNPLFVEKFICKK